MRVVLPRLTPGLEPYAVRQFRLDPAIQIVIRWCAVVRQKRVALPREALVELDHGAPQCRAAPFELGERPHDVVRVPQVLEAVRHRNARLPEHFPTAALRAQRRELRIAPVQGDAEPH